MCTGYFPVAHVKSSQPYIDPTVTAVLIPTTNLEMPHISENQVQEDSLLACILYLLQIYSWWW